MKMVPITRDGSKSKLQKKAERKRRSLQRRALKMLRRRGLDKVFIHYNGADHRIEITNDISSQYHAHDCGCVNLGCANDILNNRLRIYDSDKDRLFRNLEDYCMEQLIIKLSGLGD